MSSWGGSWAATWLGSWGGLQAIPFVPLIVEDGTGLPDADSFLSIDYADQYNADRGHTGWAEMTATQKAAALRLATDYIENQYAMQWAGRRLTGTQALGFPRDSVSGVPPLLMQATAYVAYRVTQLRFAPLIPDLGPQVISMKIGRKVISIKQLEAQYAPDYGVRQMLGPLLSPFMGAIHR